MNPDHARQVQLRDVFNSSWNKKPFQIFWMLTEASVRMTKWRAVFVRVNAYKPAGGTTLLDRLVMDDEEAVHIKLLSNYQALEEEYVGQNEIPDEIDARLGLLEAEMGKIETRPLIYLPTEIGRAGAFVTLDR